MANLSDMIKRYLLNQLIVLDILVNTLAGGSPYETISERAWRRNCTWAIKGIDWLFGLFGEKNHCYNAAEGDEARYEVIT